MKALFASAALAGLAFAAAAPAQAGPYVRSKSEIKGEGTQFKTAVNQLRVGHDWKAGDFTPYVEVGGGVETPNAATSKGFVATEVGTLVALSDSLSAKASAEVLSYNGSRDWKVTVGSKYRF